MSTVRTSLHRDAIASAALAAAICMAVAQVIGLILNPGDVAETILYGPQPQLHRLRRNVCGRVLRVPCARPEAPVPGAGIRLSRDRWQSATRHSTWARRQAGCAGGS